MLLISDLHSKSSYTRQQYFIKFHLILPCIYSWVSRDSAPFKCRGWNFKNIYLPSLCYTLFSSHPSSIRWP